MAYVNNKNKFIRFCNKNKIEIHYALRSLHETSLFNSNKKLFPNASFISKNILRLPSGPGYSFKDIYKNKFPPTPSSKKTNRQS